MAEKKTQFRNSVIEGGALKRLIKIVGDCWEWQGGCTPQGYPRKRWFDRELSARRWLYMLLFGPIPATKVLEAKCGNRLCVNPAHMRVVVLKQAQVNGEVGKLLDGDVADIRQLLADPRASRRNWQRDMISHVAERYGINRDYAVDIIGNHHRVDPKLPKGIRAIIRHYREHPPCASTS